MSSTNQAHAQGGPGPGHGVPSKRPRLFILALSSAHSAPVTDQYLSIGSDSVHSPRPNYASIWVTKVPPRQPAASARPVRRAAEESRKERRTSALFEGGALDSQISDSQYINTLGYISPSEDPATDSDNNIAAGTITQGGSSEADDHEYIPNQLEYYERHGGIDEQLTTKKWLRTLPKTSAFPQAARLLMLNFLHLSPPNSRVESHRRAQWRQIRCVLRWCSYL
ncbi:hypothetical protein C8Q77DRAFT_1159870 [Trametes polyzona]|nr:hypothetical protein C8Q77DRAFT_1159870 [Trametes polyzona]